MAPLEQDPECLVRLDGSLISKIKLHTYCVNITKIVEKLSSVEKNCRETEFCLEFVCVLDHTYGQLLPLRILLPIQEWRPLDCCARGTVRDAQNRKQQQ